MGPKEWALSSSETHCSLLFNDGPLLPEGRHTLVMEAKNGISRIRVDGISFQATIFENT